MAAAAPTGCFKCGRPGHWSRDCPSTANPNPNRFPASGSKFPAHPKAAAGEGEGEKGAEEEVKKKEKKAARTRPKLTPELLLSDEGLGYVLRHFPRGFKYHGHGHEVEDLGNLIRLYTEWHSRLIPYYSFEQFVRKVEQVGASKRVRRCIAELRERVARGGDPTKLHEPPVEEVMPDCEPVTDGTAPEEPVSSTAAPPTDGHGTDFVQEDRDPPLESHDVNPVQEDLLNEIYQKAIEEPQVPADQGIIQAPQPAASDQVHLHDPPRETTNQDAATGAVKPGKIQLTEEQRTRMEANRLKALERARLRASQAS